MLETTSKYSVQNIENCHNLTIICAGKISIFVCGLRTYIGWVNPSCHDTAAKSFRHFARFLGLQEVSMRVVGKNAPCLVLQAHQPSNIFSAACPLSALAVGRRPTYYQLCLRLNVLEFNALMHRLNMELDLQSLFGLHVYSCTHWLRPRNPAPPSAFGLIRGRYWSAKIDDVSLWLPALRSKKEVDQYTSSSSFKGFTPRFPSFFVESHPVISLNNLTKGLF